MKLKQGWECIEAKLCKKSEIKDREERKRCHPTPGGKTHVEGIWGYGKKIFQTREECVL